MLTVDPKLLKYRQEEEEEEEENEWPPHITGKTIFHCSNTMFKFYRFNGQIANLRIFLVGIHAKHFGEKTSRKQSLACKCHIGN